MSTDPTLPVRSDDAGAPAGSASPSCSVAAPSEHAVSCATASSVLEALDRDRYDVVPVGIAKDGHWVLAPATRSRCGPRRGTPPRSPAAPPASSCRPSQNSK